jgi:hypothetical protein
MFMDAVDGGAGGLAFSGSGSRKLLFTGVVTPLGVGLDADFNWGTCPFEPAGYRLDNQGECW